MDALKNAMTWDEQRFGLECDLEQYMIVSMNDFNVGAMENKGLNIFNSRLILADLQTATDVDFEKIQNVIAHEYFHNWTGNRITCQSWFDLSLKEGLTVFREQEYSADMNSREVQRIKDVDFLRANQFAEDAGPQSHPVRPTSFMAVHNFYTATIYQKGAELIRMLQFLVGRKGFDRGFADYVRSYDGQAVTIMDFVDAIGRANKLNLQQFKLWYEQNGTPTVHVQEFYDADQKEYQLRLRQTVQCGLEHKDTASPFLIPLRLGLINSTGQDLPLLSTDIAANSDGVDYLLFNQREQNFKFTQVPERPTLSLNRNFSAPVKINWEASAEQMLHLLHLLQYDSDTFNRREACYKMLLEELHRLIASYQNKHVMVPRQQIIDALGLILQDERLDHQFKSLILTIPDSEILAAEEKVVDGRVFDLALTQLYKAFVTKYSRALYAVYEALISVENPKGRALKNRILMIAALAEEPSLPTRAYQQFKTSKNMTDSYGALSALCQMDCEEADKALDDFYNSWKQDSVVFNKWLKAQALGRHPKTFLRAKKLTQAPGFSYENPSHVLSLHGYLSTNFSAMHNTNGEAYQWLCDEILFIDRQNAQLAAALCTSFNFVGKFEAQQRRFAERQIARLLSAPNLSNDSREILQAITVASL